MNSDKQFWICKPESGNALIYILIALALIGALTVILTRQSDTGANNLDREQTAILMGQMQAHISSMDSTLDQMFFTGSDAADISFVKPNSASFDIGDNIHKLYHPMGGGAVDEPPNPKLFTGTGTDPVAGWYIGRFNNVSWTPTGAFDIIMAAHQIDQSICALINKKITGSDVIPILGGTGLIATYLIDAADHSVSNDPFTPTVCAACEGKPSLCVQNGAGTEFTFYSILQGL